MKVVRGISPGQGSGVFAIAPMARDETILHFAGPLLEAHEVGSDEEHCLQIGLNLYLGPSGDVDDFVNHSCEPNGRVQIWGRTASLVALRTIWSGEEITFDYSTTSTEGPDTWAMECKCGAPTCRKVISGFASLPETDQLRLIARGLVPFYAFYAARQSL